MPIRASGQAWCSSMSWRIRDIWQMSPHPLRLAKRQTVGLEWIRFFITFWVWGVAKVTAKWQTVYWWQYFQFSKVQPALEDWRIPRPPCNLCQGAWGWGRCHLCKWSKHSSHTTTVLGKILFSSILCWYPLIFVISRCSFPQTCSGFLLPKTWTEAGDKFRDSWNWGMWRHL